MSRSAHLFQHLGQSGSHFWLNACECVPPSPTQRQGPWLAELVERVFLQKPFTYLGDAAGLGPDHRNEAKVAIKRVTHFFGFPVHTKAVFTPDCSLWSMQ